MKRVILCYTSVVGNDFTKITPQTCHVISARKLIKQMTILFVLFLVLPLRLKIKKQGDIQETLARS